MSVEWTVEPEVLLLILLLTSAASASAFFSIISLIRRAYVFALGDTLFSAGLLALATHEILHGLSQGELLAADTAAGVASILLVAGAAIMLGAVGKRAAKEGTP